MDKYVLKATLVALSMTGLAASADAFFNTDDETEAEIATKRAEVENDFRRGPQLLDEIEVDAKREKLSKLRVEMVKTENEVYASFNSVNTDPEYETRCHEETDSQTRMRGRVCTPKFVDTALAEYAAERLRGEEPIDPAVIIGEKMPAYRKQFLATVQANPKIKKQSSNYYTLYKRYLALRKAKFKNGKWFVFD
jgi:hypothetical protein